MVHLEAGLTLPDQQRFTNIDGTIREIIDVFFQNQAKVTVESEKPYALAAAQWAPTDNAMTYALTKGQGVGTHCDEIEAQTAVADFTNNKTKVDALVGAENNVGCSGGWIRGDWASAAYSGGFRYLDGVVMMAFLGVPVQNRPVNPLTGYPYTDQEISRTCYHDPAPPDLLDRIHPRMLANTNDFEGDANGNLLLMTGEIGEIASLSEGRVNCFPNCQLTQDDFDVVMATIDEAFAGKDHSRFAILYVHFPLDTMRDGPSPSPTKVQLVTTWLQQMSAYVTAGKITWVTMKEAHDRYVAWTP
jgi:hypothetical protein